MGGDTISVTAGVVSRIEVTSYIHGSMQLLGVQIDAAINSGNSGGPVFNELGRLVGMAFQSFAGSEIENVGWVIPTRVIKHFLDDYQKNKEYTGFPMLGITWQRVENPALKRHMQMRVRPPCFFCLAVFCVCSQRASLPSAACSCQTFLPFFRKPREACSQSPRAHALVPQPQLRSRCYRGGCRRMAGACS